MDPKSSKLSLISTTTRYIFACPLFPGSATGTACPRAHLKHSGCTPFAAPPCWIFRLCGWETRTHRAARAARWMENGYKIRVGGNGARFRQRGTFRGCHSRRATLRNQRQRDNSSFLSCWWMKNARPPVRSLRGKGRAGEATSLFMPNLLGIQT